MSDENTGPKSAVEVAVCPKCGRPLTQLGPNGECLRCVFDWGFASDSEESRDSTSSEVQPSGLRYGQFEVEMDADGFPVALGTGAMAVTYRARDTILNSIVALKVISRKLAENPVARARFLREARAAAQIQHPNVARVTHYGEQGGEYFYAMELVRGETLETRVQRTGSLPLPHALEIIEQAARGLAAAEACGVVHRDIKPSNVMIESDPSGLDVVKIIDYGVAKVLASQVDENFQTQASFIGTPAFASPEQFDESGKQQIDARSDIYSLGVTLWYLLTGRTPFSERTHEQIESRYNNPPFEQLKTAHVPGPVIALLKSMLAPDPKDRPQSARELLSAVHRCYTKFSTEARARKRRAVLAGAAVTFLVAAITLAAWLYQRSQSSTALERSIAVLPFQNLSEEKQNEYFADGVQDEILTDLAKIADLKVISRTSVMQYKSGVARNLRKIGEDLGVARVVEGSVQRSGNKIRVSVQLIDARTDAHLWAQTYDRDLADVFAIQSEIAKAIAEQLQTKLSPNEKKAIEQPPTTDLAAFALYSRAKTLTLNTFIGGNVENTVRQGIDLLKTATELDPTFHAAFCQLALLDDWSYSEMAHDHTPERLRAAEEAIRRAAQLQPDSAETHLARANHLYFALRDYKGAQDKLEIAARGLPNDPRIPELTGYILRRQGKPEEALRHLEQALALDPRNVALLQQIAFRYESSRRYVAAAAAYDRALQINPDDISSRILRTMVDYYLNADAEPLCKFIQHLRANVPASLPDIADNWFSCALWKREWTAAEQALAALGENPCWADGPLQMNAQFGEGLLARAIHDEPRAHRAFAAARATQEKIVEQQKDYGPPLCVLGLIDAALGNKHTALEEGRRAMDLLPRERDAINGEKLIGYFAVIAAWAGETDLAIEHLNAAIPLDGASTITSYGVLKLTPFWDPLRGDPRFEALVQRLAPTASK